MKTKTSRRNAIRELLKRKKISSQNELRDRLVESGFDVTQTTLSRDLAAIGVIRVPNQEKGYVYTLPDASVSPPAGMESRSLMSTCRSIAFSRNLAVLKCDPSFAPSIALAVDHSGIDEVLGTIAGDDTVLIVLRESSTAHRFRKLLVDRFPDLRERI